MKVKVYTVQCLDRGKDRDEVYQKMADLGGGARLLLDNFNSMVEIFMVIFNFIYLFSTQGLCYREATEVQLQQHHEDIQKLDISQGETYHAMPESAQKDSILSDEDIKKIHDAIHDPKKPSKVNINGTDYEIAIGKAGCRFVRIDNVTYIEQNKDKKTKYAKMALEGKKITWITHKGSWGLIVDGEFVRR